MFKFFRKNRLFFDILAIIFWSVLGTSKIFFEETDEAKRKLNLLFGIIAFVMAAIKMIDVIGWFLNKGKEKKTE